MPKPPTDWHHSQRHKPIPESPVNKARRLRTERIAKVIAEAQASAEVRQFPAQPERPKPEAPVLLSPPRSQAATCACWSRRSASARSCGN
jgi:hypothetical protein